MRVNVIHPAELGSAEIESWHQMQRATLRNATSLYALRTVRRHPALPQAADIVLRRSGVSSRTYGRILPKGAL